MSYRLECHTSRLNSSMCIFKVVDDFTDFVAAVIENPAGPVLEERIAFNYTVRSGGGRGTEISLTNGHMAHITGIHPSRLCDDVIITVRIWNSTTVEWDPESVISLCDIDHPDIQRFFHPDEAPKKFLKKIDAIAFHFDLDKDQVVTFLKRVKDKTKRVRKVIEVKNDISKSVVQMLCSSMFVKDPIDMGDVDVLDDTYLKYKNRTMKIGKFISKNYKDAAKLLEEYSLLKKKSSYVGTVILSNKLVDCLMASDLTTGWTSCQSFKGGRWVANQLYYNHPDNYLVTLEDKIGQKMWRCWVSRVLIRPAASSASVDVIGYLFGRQYPEPLDISRIVRMHFMREIAKVPLFHTYSTQAYQTHIVKPEDGCSCDDCRKLTSMFHIGATTVNTMDGLNVPYPDVSNGHEGMYVCVPQDAQLSKVVLYNIQLLLNKNTDVTCVRCCHKKDVNCIRGTGVCKNCATQCGDHTCVSCGSVFEDGDYYLEDGDIYCGDCHNDSFTYCDACDNHGLSDDYTYVESASASYCPDCYAERYQQCEMCNSYVDNDDVFLYCNTEGDDKTVCNECFDQYAAYCDDCGEAYVKSLLIEYRDQFLCPTCLAAAILKNDEEETDA